MTNVPSAKILSSLAVGLLLLAPAQAQQWGPNGNGTLLHQDDQRWVAFSATKVVADDAKGEYTATFSPAMIARDDKPFVITGYAMPIGTDFSFGGRVRRLDHFILTRRSPTCPFCPPNEPTEAIEVFAAAPITVTPFPLTLRGRLHLIGKSEEGLFYRMNDAQAG